VTFFSGLVDKYNRLRCLQDSIYQKLLLDARQSLSVPAYPPRRLFIYGHQRSTNPANFVKIDPVDVEIIGLTKITKIYKTTAKRKPSPKRLRESG